MSNTSDFNNISCCFDEKMQCFSKKELEEDPDLKLGTEKKGNDYSSDEELFRVIDETQNLLDDSVEHSTTTSVIKSPSLSTALSTVTNKVHRDLKKSLSLPSSAAKSAVTDELDQPETPRATLENNSFTQSSLRRSQRVSTQKKTQATEKRLEQRSSSAAAAPKTSNDTSQFLSPDFAYMTAQSSLSKQRPFSVATPAMSNDDTQFLSLDFESVMAQSALSNSLSATDQYSDMKQLFPMLSDPLILTPPDSVMSQSLVSSYSVVPGLDEWNQLYLSRPQMGSQIAIWNWLGAVRSAAFRFPPSAVTHEESRLDSWTKATTQSVPCDMSISLADAFIKDDYGGDITTFNETDDDIANTFESDFLKEDESARVTEETKQDLAVEKKEVMPPYEKSAGKTSDEISPIRIEFQGMGNHAAADDSSEKENANASNDEIVSEPTECSASQKTGLADKAVSFKELFSPKLKKATGTTYRKTPHIKASQQIPRQTLASNPYAPGYHPDTPLDKAHYPTTPCGCDSPSTNIPDSWVQLFLDRPDPFEISTKDFLAWLGEVSDILENANVNISTVAVSCMPTVTHDSQAQRNVSGVLTHDDE